MSEKYDTPAARYGAMLRATRQQQDPEPDPWIPVDRPGGHDPRPADMTHRRCQP